MYFKQRCNLFLKRMRFYSLLPFVYSFSSFANESSGSKSATPSTLEQLFPFIIFGLIFYILFIRPNQKKHKLHGDFLSKIKRGDEVLTNSGIYGKIEGLTDNFVILEVADNTRIRVVKSQIATWTGESKPSTNTKRT